MTMTPSTRVESAVAKGEEAFWKAVAAEFPECSTGDLGVEDTVQVRTALTRGVRRWIHDNLDATMVSKVNH